MKDGAKKTILGLSYFLIGAFLQIFYCLILNKYSDGLSASQTLNLRMAVFGLSVGLYFVGFITLMAVKNDK